MLLTIISIASIFALNVITPGASFVLTLQHSLSHGRRTGLAVALGLSAADIMFAMLALWGVGALLQAHAGILAAIGCIGGAWLAMLGMQMFMRTRTLEENVVAVSGGSELPWRKAAHTGLSAGLVNPQAIVFFAGVFLAGVSSQLSSMQTLAILAAVAVTSVAVRCGIAWMVSIPDVRRVYLARKKYVESLSAAALFAFGVKLATKAMVPWALKLVASLGFTAYIAH